MDLINRLCAQYDRETAKNAAGKKLYIIGDSPFTRALERKAEKLGVDYKAPYPDRFYYGQPVYLSAIVDNEAGLGKVFLPDWQDIDRISNPGLSCCAQAVLDVLLELGVSGKAVCVIGRGHAVQGLAEELVRADATVTVCHSKTPSLYEATLYADIVVVAAPVRPAQVCPLVGKTVVDVSESFDSLKDKPGYIGGIGRLTISIMLNRATGGIV